MAEYRLYVPEEIDQKIREKVTNAGLNYELALKFALALGKDDISRDLEGITVTECNPELPTGAKDPLVNISQELSELVNKINEDVERLGR